MIFRHQYSKQLTNRTRTKMPISFGNFFFNLKVIAGEKNFQKQKPKLPFINVYILIVYIWHYIP